MLDYKFSTIKRTDDATFVTMRVYEGENVPIDGKLQYQRSRMVEEHKLRFRGNIPDEDLREVCNERLANVALTLGKIIIPAQVVVRSPDLKPLVERINVES